MIGQIGRLDTRIIIQAATDAVDAQGSVTKTWATVVTVWAAVKILGATETTNGNERSASRDYQFTVRKQSALAAIGAGHRILWDGVYFDISAVQAMPEGRPDYYLITASEKA